MKCFLEREYLDKKSITMFFLLEYVYKVRMSIQHWSRRTAERNASWGPQRAAGGTWRSGAVSGWTFWLLSWPPPSLPSSQPCLWRCRNLPLASSDLEERQKRRSILFCMIFVNFWKKRPVDTSKCNDTYLCKR